MNFFVPTVDLVMICNTLYNYLDDLPDIVNKIKPWLSESGIIVMQVDYSPLLHTIGIILR